MDEHAPKPYPVDISMAYPERSSRWLAFFTLTFFVKMILLIPHLFILTVIGVASSLGSIAAQVVVLFTGKYPRSLFMLLKAVTLWQTRLNAYMMGMTDQYPPFDLGIPEKKEAAKALWWTLGISLLLVIIVIVIMVTSFQNMEFAP